MTPRKLLIVAAAVAVMAGLWYLFRPELLFVNKEVHEELPSPVGAAAPTTTTTPPTTTTPTTTGPTTTAAG